jgi:hypothetical protein
MPRPDGPQFQRSGDPVTPPDGVKTTKWGLRNSDDPYKYGHATFRDFVWNEGADRGKSRGIAYEFNCKKCGHSLRWDSRDDEVDRRSSNAFGMGFTSHINSCWGGDCSLGPIENL